MDDPIPVFEPATGIETIKAVVDALHVGWLGMGATTKAFEDAIATYLGAEERHVLATNTGTSALHAALVAAGIDRGDEVIVASFNFVADHQAITQTGAEPVFCDIREEDLGLDVQRLVDLISPRTRAILPLHYGGMPCDIDRIYMLAEQHGLRVIEDATHAFGSSHRGRKIGSFGDMTCFSFDPVKVVTSIDGGAIICSSEDELQRLRHHRFLGIDRETTERYKNERAWEYDVLCQGFRYHMTNVNAAIGLSQLARVDGFIESRRSVCRRYTSAFKDVPGLTVPPTTFDHVSPFIYFLRVRSDWRIGLIEHLRERRVSTGVHFLPAHEFSFYRECRRGPLPVTAKVCSEILTLPLHSHMDDAKVERVIDGVLSFVSRHA